MCLYCFASCCVHKIHFHANEWIFFFVLHTIISWAVSSVNSSRLTHSLWLISLCLSWILLPVFEALQWADDCLGRDYYTNLSTLFCQALSPGRLCLCVCFLVSLHFHYTRESVCMYAPLWGSLWVLMPICSIYVFTIHACVWVLLQSSILPWQPPLPSGCHHVWPAANIHHSTCC